MAERFFATPPYFCWQLAFYRHLSTSGRQNMVKTALQPLFVNRAFVALYVTIVSPVRPTQIRKWRENEKILQFQVALFYQLCNRRHCKRKPPTRSHRNRYQYPNIKGHKTEWMKNLFLFWQHTWYLSRSPRTCPCKFFLAGVNFYRFNAKNWQFTVYFAVITQKLAIYCVFCRNLRVFSV